MSDQPDDEQPNPFKGTPFEHLFSGGGFDLSKLGLGGLGGPGGAGGGGMPDLGALFGQIQSMMQPYDGALNWDVAVDIARKAVAQQPDPTPSAKQADAVADAVRLADHWLDEATEFPSGVTSTAAWSRAEWIVGTLDVWKVLIEPVAEQSVHGLSGALPPEAAAQAAPLMGILGKAVGAMLATQVGSGFGELATEVLTASDIGLPLAARG